MRDVTTHCGAPVKLICKPERYGTLPVGEAGKVVRFGAGEVVAIISVGGAGHGYEWVTGGIGLLGDDPERNDK